MYGLSGLWLIGIKTPGPFAVRITRTLSRILMMKEIYFGNHAKELFFSSRTSSEALFSLDKFKLVATFICLKTKNVATCRSIKSKLRKVFIRPNKASILMSIFIVNFKWKWRQIKYPKSLYLFQCTLLLLCPQSRFCFFGKLYMPWLLFGSITFGVLHLFYRP